MSNKEMQVPAKIYPPFLFPQSLPDPDFPETGRLRTCPLTQQSLERRGMACVGRFGHIFVALKWFFGEAYSRMYATPKAGIAIFNLPLKKILIKYAFLKRL